MAENIRLALDIAALAAVVYAVVKGIRKADADGNSLRAQVVRNTAWIAGHEIWSEKQTEQMQGILEDIAYIRGQMESAERKAR